MIENEMYLGPFIHAQKLKVGQLQSMIFQDTNISPFYLTEDKREKRKYDIETNGEKETTQTQAFLIDQIKEKTGMQKVGGNLDEVQKLATNLNILTKTTSKKIPEGWVGKLKGMMQVLCEMGFLNSSKSSK